MTALYDGDVLARAEGAAAQAAQAFVNHTSTESGVVVHAPAGAGKTGLVCRVVQQARTSRMRLVVGTPTNEQAFGLVRRLASTGVGPITYLPSRSLVLPPDLARLANVTVVEGKEAAGAGLLVGTLDKLCDASARGYLSGFDGLVMDEAFQADSRRYFGVGGLAPKHLLVGDAGQLSPFSTYSEADRWRGLPEDPLQTAVGVLRRNHPDTLVVPLPVSRRLDARAVPLARAFYPGFHFEAAVLEGTRELRLGRATARGRRERAIDAALEGAAAFGWAHLELPAAPVLQADPEAIELFVALLQRLLSRKPTVRCERVLKATALAPERIAVGVSHNDQKNLLRVRLDQACLGRVVVDTANKLQGLEFDVVVAWHPLAGLVEADEFHLDPGRLCVLLTRHRHACVVVGRAGDRELLAGVPPATRAYLGFDPNPVLDGWGAHEAVFAGLERMGVQG